MADEAISCLISSWHRMEIILLQLTSFALVYNKPENGARNLPKKKVPGWSSPEELFLMTSGTFLWEVDKRIGWVGGWVSGWV